MIPYAVLAAYQITASAHQAETIREQARFKEMVDEQNAQFVELDAFNAEAFGYGEAARYEAVADSQIADQRVAYASQNVDVGYGTAAEVQAESKLVKGLNVLSLQKQARERSKGLRNEAKNIRLGSRFSSMQSEMEANATQNAGLIGAAQTGLSGYSKNY